jgi:hypothetical protein
MYPTRATRTPLPQTTPEARNNGEHRRGTIPSPPRLPDPVEERKVFAPVTLGETPGNSAECRTKTTDDTEEYVREMKAMVAEYLQLLTILTKVRNKTGVQ